MSLLVALMPPGLCSCWLNPAAAEVHVHFGSSDAGHSHEYLFTLSSGTIAGARVPVDPVMSLLLASVLALLWFRLPAAQAAPGRAWCLPPDVPPPEFRFSGVHA